MVGIGDNKKKVVCCFCGESLLMFKALVIVVRPHIDSEEEQTLFCHKEHLIEKIHKSIPLNPEFFDTKE